MGSDGGQMGSDGVRWGQVGTALSKRRHISSVWTCKHKLDVFALPNYLVGPHNDTICNNILVQTLKKVQCIYIIYISFTLLE